MNLYYKIRNAFRELKYDFRRRCQRFKRGYSYGDVWDMDYWFIRTVKPMLTHLRDHGIGIPNELYQDGDDKEREAWEAVLTEMIECLEDMDRYAVEEKYNLHGDSYQRSWDIVEKNKNRFFELFSKWFFSLWD